MESGHNYFSKYFIIDIHQCHRPIIMLQVSLISLMPFLPCSLSWVVEVLHPFCLYIY